MYRFSTTFMIFQLKFWTLCNQLVSNDLHVHTILTSLKVWKCCLFFFFYKKYAEFGNKKKVDEEEKYSWLDLFSKRYTNKSAYLLICFHLIRWLCFNLKQICIFFLLLVFPLWRYCSIVSGCYYHQLIAVALNIEHSWSRTKKNWTINYRNFTGKTLYEI